MQKPCVVESVSTDALKVSISKVWSFLFCEEMPMEMLQHAYMPAVSRFARLLKPARIYGITDLAFTS